MTFAAVSPVPIPSVALLPPATPWWEWALIGLLILGALAYATTLVRALPRPRRAWIAPALLMLLTGAIVLVHLGWADHREMLRVEQVADIDAATEAFASDLGDAYGVTIDPQWISVIAYPSRDSDIVEITRADGTLAKCWLWVDTAGATRTATLEIDACTAG